MEIARKVLEDGYVLCDSCLGRLFGLRGRGLSNAERGRAIKTVLFLEAYKSISRECDINMLKALSSSGYEPAREALLSLGLEAPEAVKCYVCEGVTQKYDELAKRVADATHDYEFATFQVGVRLPYSILRREEELWRLYGIQDAESLKNEVSREIGKLFSKLSGKKYAPEKPELLVIIDFEKNTIEVNPSPVFICGRYRKLVRGLPQNRWLYPDERVKYNTSIEELISRPAVEMFGATDSKFHAGGREDIDVRTLGKGRPFVLELRGSKRRRVDLQEVERVINERASGLVEVYGLEYCDRDSVKKVKGLAEIAKKVYVARVIFSEPVSDDEVEKINSYFKDVSVVEQRTPLRVLHRRADRLRRKVVYRVEAKRVGEKEIELVVESQGGLYIKEFIHGDQGRTKPSIAELLGKSVESIELDLISVD